MKSALARQISIQVALVIFGAMLLYAVLQMVNGEAGPVQLLVRHLWHTLALGGLVYVVLLWRLRKLVLGPLQQVFQQGYQMTQGKFEHKEYVRADNEIDRVGDMMNLIAEHLKFLRSTSWKDYADSIERHIEFIKGRDDLPLDVVSDLACVESELRKMEVAIMRFIEAPSRPEETSSVKHAKYAHV